METEIDLKQRFRAHEEPALWQSHNGAWFLLHIAVLVLFA
jgi:hypothetical protein